MFSLGADTLTVRGKATTFHQNQSNFEEPSENTVTMTVTRSGAADDDRLVVRKPNVGSGPKDQIFRSVPATSRCHFRFCHVENASVECPFAERERRVRPEGSGEVAAAPARNLIHLISVC